MSSFLQIAKETGRAGRRRLLQLRDLLTDDTFASVAGHHLPTDWQETLAEASQGLKQNRDFEGAKIGGLLAVNMDASERFKSRHW